MLVSGFDGSELVPGLSSSTVATSSFGAWSTIGCSVSCGVSIPERSDDSTEGGVAMTSDSDCSDSIKESVAPAAINTTKTAAAKIIVSSDTTLQTCLINSERDLALQEANLTLQIKNKEAELAACSLRLTENQQLYEQHINFLEKQAVRPQWETPVYFAVGVLTGAALVYSSSVVLKNIGSN